MAKYALFHKGFTFYAIKHSKAALVTFKMACDFNALNDRIKKMVHNNI